VQGTRAPYMVLFWAAKKDEKRAKICQITALSKIGNPVNTAEIQGSSMTPDRHG
jgi:hypothetical protein